MQLNGTKWKFLNSPIVIWVLSSVAIALITTTYSWYEHQIKNENSIRKLELEISLRLSNFISYSEGDINFDDSKEAILALEIPVKSKLSFSLYHENRNRSVTSLLLDYRDLLVSYKLEDTWVRYKAVNQALVLWREELVDVHKYLVSKDKNQMPEYIGVIRESVQRIHNFLQLEYSIASKWGGRIWKEEEEEE